MLDGTACSLARPDKPTSGYYRHRRSGEKPCGECTALFVARVRRNQAISGSGRTTYAGECERCGTDFSSTKRSQRFCSLSCAKRRPKSTALVRWVPPIKTPGPRWRRKPVKHPPLYGSLFVYGPCAWCEEPFMALAGSFSTRSLYCSKRCAKNASNNRRGRFVIPAKRRLAIYERDGWVCQLCREPVDPAATDIWRPTLDHIAPQSHQLIPDHSDANLRLAHMWCNSVRGDESHYTEDDLRVA